MNPAELVWFAPTCLDDAYGCGY